jgi:hypothetical protein
MRAGGFQHMSLGIAHLTFRRQSDKLLLRNDSHEGLSKAAGGDFLGRELGLLIRDLTGVLLLIAAITKAVDRHNSAAALAMALGLRRARRVLPPLLAMEVAIGIALLWGLIPPASLAFAAALFASFALYLARTRGATVGCGCFGLGIPSRATRFTIARNLAIALAAAVVAISRHHPGQAAASPAVRSGSY